MIVEYECAFCGIVVRKQQTKNMIHRFCSMDCKAAWQREQKPVNKEWLHQKYIVEGLDCTQISKIVNRNPKQVWQWLKGYEIPTRKRGTTGNEKYSKGHKGFKHTDETKEKIRQARLKDGHVPYLRNGVHHLKGKKGADTPNWKGGITAERQATYGSEEWKQASKTVWERDNATCQRCGLYHNLNRDVSFDIHHIVSFAVVEKRCDPSNLVLLCEPCHYWVHSSKNINKEFINEHNSN